jgi:large subunit ribosomal protein L15
MPLQRRVPKFGFKNNNKEYFKALNLDVLEGLAEKTGSTNLSLQVLIDNGVVGKNDKVKILGRGELKSKISVEAHALSETAAKAIEKVGGTATILK